MIVTVAEAFAQDAEVDEHDEEESHREPEIPLVDFSIGKQIKQNARQQPDEGGGSQSHSQIGQGPVLDEKLQPRHAVAEINHDQAGDDQQGESEPGFECSLQGLFHCAFQFVYWRQVYHR